MQNKKKKMMRKYALLLILSIFGISFMKINSVSAKTISNVALKNLIERVEVVKEKDVRVPTIQVMHTTPTRIVQFDHQLTTEEIDTYENDYDLEFQSNGNKNRYIVKPNSEELFYQFTSSREILKSANNDEYTVNAQTVDWGINSMNVSKAWNYSPAITGEDVVVAVIDTGVDFSHSDLSGNLLPGGYDFYNNDNDPSDDEGHGTHVAGIIAALNNDEGTVGAAYNAKILPYKVCNSSGSCDLLAIADAIDAATAAGVDIINMSLGGPSANSIMQDSINDALNAGITIVASAGNGGDDLIADYGCLYPAAYTGVVCVGAVDSSDNHASFSNYAPEVNIAAPGVLIRSLDLNGTTIMMSGTSMAAPYYSGVAALITSQIQDLCISEPTNEACSDVSGYVQAIIEETARDVGDPGRDDYFGAGIVDLSDLYEGTETAYSLIEPNLRISSDYLQTVTISNRNGYDLNITSCEVLSQNKTRTFSSSTFDVGALEVNGAYYLVDAASFEKNVFSFATPIVLSSASSEDFSFAFSLGAENQMPDEIEHGFVCYYDNPETPEVENQATSYTTMTSYVRRPQSLYDISLRFGNLPNYPKLTPYQATLWRTVYIDNFDPATTKLVFIRLWDSTTRSFRTRYTRWTSPTTRSIRATYLPRYHRYMYNFMFEDRETGIQMRKTIVFFTK